MKAVLISIQPKWVEMIVSGQKTIEVRKSKPKLERPFKCYIYCTKDNTFAENTLRGFDDNGKAICFKANKGKVVGEFVCDKIYEIKPYFDRADLLTHYECGWKHGEDFDCLSFSELNSYLSGNVGFGWHISDLKIYDKPKELREFFTPIGKRPSYMIERPPQSWCYVEVEE